MYLSLKFASLQMVIFFNVELFIIIIVIVIINGSHISSFLFYLHDPIFLFVPSYLSNIVW